MVGGEDRGRRGGGGRRDGIGGTKGKEGWYKSGRVREEREGRERLEGEGKEERRGA